MDINNILDWGWIVPIAYDILIRLFPTTKDWTILNKVIDIVEYIFPNRKSGGGKIRMVRKRETN